MEATRSTVKVTGLAVAAEGVMVVTAPLDEVSVTVVPAPKPSPVSVSCWLVFGTATVPARITVPVAVVTGTCVACRGIRYDTTAPKRVGATVVTLVTSYGAPTPDTEITWPAGTLPVPDSPRVTVVVLPAVLAIDLLMTVRGAGAACLVAAMYGCEIAIRSGAIVVTSPAAPAFRSHCTGLSCADPGATAITPTCVGAVSVTVQSPGQAWN